MRSFWHSTSAVSANIIMPCIFGYRCCDSDSYILLQEAKLYSRTLKTTFSIEVQGWVNFTYIMELTKKFMKTQEVSHDPVVEGFSISDNPLLASDLLLGGHVTIYDSHFE